MSSSERSPDASEEIRQYAIQVRKAIEEQLKDASKYSGKECSLRMYMAPVSYTHLTLPTSKQRCRSR
ncbi:cell envelope integrity TolA C-terminal domain-containing protein, partial [Escherichia coli]